MYDGLTKKHRTDLYLENRIHQTNHIQDDKTLKIEDKTSMMNAGRRHVSCGLAHKGCRTFDGITKTKAEQYAAEPSLWSFVGVRSTKQSVFIRKEPDAEKHQAIIERGLYS